MAYANFTDFITSAQGITVNAAVSLAALALSVFSFVRTDRAKRTELGKDFQTEYNDTIQKIASFAREREALKRSLGDEFRKIANTKQRIELGDNLDLQIAHADFLLKTGKVNPSDISLKIIGGLLSEAGKTAEAERKYEEAFKVSSSDYEQATNRRALGRAQILNNDIKKGRASILQAIDDFRTAARNIAYDEKAMAVQVAECWRRLIEAELQVNQVEYLTEDLQSFAKAKSKVVDIGDRVQFEHAEIEISVLMSGAGLVIVTQP